MFSGPHHGAMPLTRMKDDYTILDGVKFWMVDKGHPVLCRVTHEAASDAYDLGANVDDAGCVLVTSEALDRVSRRA